MEDTSRKISQLQDCLLWQEENKLENVGWFFTQQQGRA